MTWPRAQLQFQKVQPCPDKLWPSGHGAHPGSASWRTCCRQLQAEEGQGIPRSRMAGRPVAHRELAAVNFSCSYLQPLQTLPLAPPGRSNHSPAACAGESRCPARWRASSSNSAALWHRYLRAFPGMRGSKTASLKEDQCVGTSSQVFAPTPFPAGSESPCLEVVSSLTLKW